MGSSFCCSFNYKSNESVNQLDFSNCNKLIVLKQLLKYNIYRIREEIDKIISQNPSFNLEDLDGGFQEKMKDNNEAFFYYIQLDATLVKLIVKIDALLENDLRLEVPDNQELIAEENINIDNNAFDLKILNEKDYLIQIIPYVNEIFNTEENKNEEQLHKLENEMYKRISVE